jgi:hypothetical protein
LRAHRRRCGLTIRLTQFAEQKIARKVTASMRTPAILVLALGLVVSACGKAQQTKEGAASVDARAQRAVVNMGGGQNTTLGMSAPADLPAYAAVYPGATVSSSVTGVGGSTSGMLTFTTPDAPEQVLGFYRQRAAAAGLTRVAETAQNKAQTFVASKPGSSETVNVTTAPDPAGGTFVQLTYG